MYVLVQNDVGGIAATATHVVKKKQPESRIFDSRLILRVKLVTVHHYPLGMTLSSEFLRTHCIVLAADLSAYGNDLETFLLQLASNCRNDLRRGENGPPTAVLPGLRQSQASHDVSCTDCDACICPD